MQISILPLALSLLPLALAQYDNTPSKATTTSSAGSPTVTGKIHTVNVGKDSQLVFDPDTITADVGDLIEWHFFPPTHSVIEASFAAPCAPLENAFASGGFVTTTGENANVFRIVVNSTAPIWYYCGFPGHCQAGMVGVINPPSNATNKDFAAKAATAPSVAGPRNATGGVVGPAASQGSASTTSGSAASATKSASASVSAKSFGNESRGSIQWTTLGLTSFLAILFGGMML